MSTNLSSLFSLGRNKRHIDDELSHIIVFVKGIIVREDLITSIIAPYNTVANTEGPLRLKTAIQTYLLLEDFITKNKPMVVQKVYTKTSLRAEISTKFSLDKLPEAFRLIFLPEKEQLFLLYVSYTKQLSSYIINQVGITGLQTLVTSLTNGTAFSGLTIDDEKTMDSLYQHIPAISTQELTALFLKVNTGLYHNISSSFGENTALELTQKCYGEVKDTYTYDLIALFLQAIPDGILDKERVAYMAREDLEKQALNVAEEKLRREMAEKSAKTLQEEKAIIEQKVQEQTAVINHEKEELQKAVEKINSSLLQAQRNEVKLLASVKGLPMGFILTDTENTIVICNEAAKMILRSSTELKTVEDIIALLQHKLDISEIIGRSRNDNLPVELEEFELHDQILHITVSPIFLTEPQKEYIGAAILINDITEAKQLERTKDEFFAIASHELRTPLTAIRGSVSVLKNYYGDKIAADDIPKLINYIDQSSVRLIDIVNEFLNVSRIEQGRITMKNEAFPMEQLIGETVNELRNLTDSKNLFLRFDTPSHPLPNVFADKDKTKQVLVNLIGNAIKFTSTGGITLTAEDANGFVLVRITDTGSGIPVANQRLLFRKFQQADRNIFTHDASRGTGLGLYISKKLIETMGGTILLERSEENKGSTFSISLPTEQQLSV